MEFFEETNKIIEEGLDESINIVDFMESLLQQIDGKTIEAKLVEKFKKAMTDLHHIFDSEQVDMGEYTIIDISVFHKKVEDSEYLVCLTHILQSADASYVYIPEVALIKINNSTS